MFQIKIISGGEKMKNKRLIIWVFVAVTIITTYNCLAAEQQLKEVQGIQIHDENKDQQLKEIEKCVSQRRRQIEDSYTNRILELRLRAASEIKLLEVAETSKPNWADITEWADFAETVLQINGCERESYGLIKATTETSDKRLALALSRIAQRKNDLLSRSEMEALKLKNQKKYALTAELADLEKPLREDASRPKSQATHGLVTGIVHSPEKSSAVVDQKIVHEGDKIRDVVVVKIYKDKVVFKKNDNKWEQAVRQTPEAYWK